VPSLLRSLNSKHIQNLLDLGVLVLMLCIGTLSVEFSDFVKTYVYLLLFNLYLLPFDLVIRSACVLNLTLFKNIVIISL